MNDIVWTDSFFLIDDWDLCDVILSVFLHHHRRRWHSTTVMMGVVRGRSAQSWGGSIDRSSSERGVKVTHHR